jgi:hypothetical protein
VNRKRIDYELLVWIVLLAIGLLLMAIVLVWGQDRNSDHGQTGGQIKPSTSGKLMVDADPEKTLILAAARTYVIENSTPEAKFKLELIKRTGKWALVRAIPVRPFITDEAEVIMEKTDQGWVGRVMGTALDDWEERLPELFR